MHGHSRSIRPVVIVLALSMVMTSACAQAQNFARQQQTQLDQIEIGTTTREQVEAKFGKPLDVQVERGAEAGIQSWGYAYTQLARHPGRFLPFVGVFFVADVMDVESRAFAIDFSKEGAVAGITQRKLSRYTIEPVWPGSDEEVPVYGYRNLNARSALGLRDTSY